MAQLPESELWIPPCPHHAQTIVSPIRMFIPLDEPANALNWQLYLELSVNLVAVVVVCVKFRATIS